VQELPGEVPVGNIPRAITVHATGEITRACVPGDIITLTGIFLPTPYTGTFNYNYGSFLSIIRCTC
jgi:DNA replication licensing factor MCM7